MVEPQCIRVKPLEVPEAMGPDNHWLTYASAAQSLGDPGKGILEAPLAMPEDLHGAMSDHSKELLSRSLGMQYLIWSRAMELRALSRACALVSGPHRYLGRGSMLKRKDCSLMTRSVQAQSFRNPDLSVWSPASSR
eukprot:1485194-Pyramimonas_sp.AAC.1